LTKRPAKSKVERMNRLVLSLLTVNIGCSLKNAFEVLRAGRAYSCSNLITARLYEEITFTTSKLTGQHTDVLKTRFEQNKKKAVPEVYEVSPASL